MASHVRAAVLTWCGIRTNHDPRVQKPPPKSELVYVIIGEILELLLNKCYINLKEIYFLKTLYVPLYTSTKTKFLVFQ